MPIYEYANKQLRIIRYDNNPIPDNQRSIEVFVMQNDKKILSEMQTLDREGNFGITTTLTEKSTNYIVNVSHACN